MDGAHRSRRACRDGAGSNGAEPAIANPGEYLQTRCRAWWRADVAPRRVALHPAADRAKATRGAGPAHHGVGKSDTTEPPTNDCENPAAVQRLGHVDTAGRLESGRQAGSQG